MQTGRDEQSKPTPCVAATFSHPKLGSGVGDKVGTKGVGLKQLRECAEASGLEVGDEGSWGFRNLCGLGIKSVSSSVSGHVLRGAWP